ncbi:MAG: sulfur carrier protein ThiS [Putridiphycobacter sp.]|nr:sulfur carrier protein ThiS [Putridiphycobacter sp.]
MIQVTINSNSHKVKPETTISGLLLNISQKEDGIAIAINNIVIPKANWSNHQLKSNDNILIIKATQGG